MMLNPFFTVAARSHLEQLEAGQEKLVQTYLCGPTPDMPVDIKELEKFRRLYSFRFFQQFQTDECFEHWLRVASPGTLKVEETYLTEYRALRAGTPSPLLTSGKNACPDYSFEIETQYERLLAKPYYDFMHSLVPG